MAKVPVLKAANGTNIEVVGEAYLDFKKDGKKCSMKFLDADVKRPLGSVTALVDAGNKVMFAPSGSYIENVATSERIPLKRSRGVYVMRLKVDDVTMKDVEKIMIKKQGIDMEVDEVDEEEENKGEDMVFAARLPEHHMNVFRRQV